MMVTGMTVFQPVDLVGYAAGSAAMVIMVPQLLKTLRLRSSDEVSVMSICFIALANLLWGIYGSIIGRMPMIVMNAVGIAVNIATLAAVARYRGKKHAER
jgi:uncharacterized protein with PQ loop repeat